MDSSPHRGHLILVGLPGAGKTTTGALVAAALGTRVIDLDAEIERAAGVSVATIFATQGEEGFRALERAATESQVGTPPAVITPGGGWMTQPEVVSLLRPPARIIHLQVSPETALRRMGALAATRPLLHHADPLRELQRLEEARRDVYAGADAQLDTEAIVMQELVAQITALASRWGVGIG